MLCFPKKSGSKISQTIKNRAENVLIVEEALSRKDLTVRDHTVMVKFLKAGNAFYSGEGMKLKERVRNEVNYYDEILKHNRSTQLMGDKSTGLVTSSDKFIKNFLTLYKDSKHNQGFVFCLLKSYADKGMFVYLFYEWLLKH